MTEHIGVLDLGGTTYKVGLSSRPPGNRIDVIGTVDTPRYVGTGTNAAVERFGASLDAAIDLLFAIESSSVEFTAIGVSSRGPFASDVVAGGLLLRSDSFEIFKQDRSSPTYPLEAHLRSRLDGTRTGVELPFVIVNDAVANLHAELAFGSAAGSENVALLIVGTGIGFVAHGPQGPVVDEFGNGPEPSVTSIDELGCSLTDATNGGALERRFGRRPGAGDAEMAAFAARHLTNALAPLLAASNVQVLVVSGGVCDRLGETFCSAMQRELAGLSDLAISVRAGAFPADVVGLVGGALVAEAQRHLPAN